jgi:hypothetical protein
MLEMSVDNTVVLDAEEFSQSFQWPLATPDDGEDERKTKGLELYAERG